MLPKKQPKDLAKMFPTANSQAIDLLKKMLAFAPQDRITIEEALKHEYLKSLHCPDDEVLKHFVISYRIEAFPCFPSQPASRWQKLTSSSSRSN